MSGLKPVVELTILNKHAMFVMLEHNIRDGEYDLYLIPSTHRVVSVELLEAAAGVLENAHWQALTEKGKELREIINQVPKATDRG